VSAWVAENHLTLGQIATEEKSNEITAIPKLLGLLELRGATVTVDAMGCQREVAEKVIDKGADYVMGLKGNQGAAHSEVRAYFEEGRAAGFPTSEFSFAESVDGSEHGRLEVRRVWVSQDVAWFQDLPKWKGLRSVILVERERTVGTETSKEASYYWSSHAADAAALAKMIRGHWGQGRECLQTRRQSQVQASWVGPGVSADAPGGGSCPGEP
jgi:predicted transposase YbfD/YdcC